MLPLFTTIVLVCSAVYCLVRWKFRKFYELSAQLDGPFNYPLVGSAHIMAGKNTEEIIQVAIDNVEKYGMIFKVWMGPKLTLTIGIVEDVDIILNSPDCLDKGFFYRFFDCDKGLISAPADIWKSHRKLLNSSFNMKILKSFIPIFNEKTITLTEKLGALVGNGPFNFYEVVSRCTLDMICATTLGTNLNYQNDIAEGDIATQATEKYMAMVTLRTFNIFHHLDFFYKLTKEYKLSEITRELAVKVSRRVIKIKNENLKAVDQIEKISETDDIEYRKPQIFIDQIYQLSKQTPDVIDDVSIRDEIDTIISAGYETSALTMSHTILLLAIHQDIQEKVVAELRNAFYDENEIPDFDILSKLEYTEMVIKESLRVLPVVPFIVRTTTADVRISTKQLVIPAGVMINIPIYHMHRDKTHWGPKADEFNPENFTKENIAKRHPCTFIPFSYGSRNCIGNKYAMLSIKTMLANILRKYKFSTTYTMDTIVKKFEITLKLNHKHYVTVEKRNLKE